MPKSRLILTLVLSYAALSFYEPFWRLTIRALMEGKDFFWDYAGISGNGMSGDYWIIVLITILGLTLLSMGWRGANRLFQWLIVIWASLLLLSSVAIVASDPGIKIIAETLHMELPYAFVILPFDILFFTFTLYWVIKYRKTNKEQTTPRMNRKNYTFLAIAIALLPLEYIFFNLGKQHDAYDQAGVFLTFIQFAILNLSLFPWKLTSNKQHVIKEEGDGIGS